MNAANGDVPASTRFAGVHLVWGDDTVTRRADGLTVGDRIVWPDVAVATITVLTVTAVAVHDRSIVVFTDGKPRRLYLPQFGRVRILKAATS